MPFASFAKGLDPKSAKLSDFGGNEVVCCSPQDDVDKAREAMQQHKVQRILVCDAQKKPVGVISLQDLARSESEGEVGQTVREVKEEGGGYISGSRAGGAGMPPLLLRFPHWIKLPVLHRCGTLRACVPPQRW